MPPLLVGYICAQAYCFLYLLGCDDSRETHRLSRAAISCVGKCSSSSSASSFFLFLLGGGCIFAGTTGGPMFNVGRLQMILVGPGRLNKVSSVASLEIYVWKAKQQHGQID